MSVSLALIPVALTLRLVMGKKRFDEWVESSLVRFPTNFKHELKLVRTVRRAGYDADKWGGSIKTHIDGENLFFFWEQIDGKWVATFSKSDAKPLIDQFMAEINKSAGRNVWESTDAEQTVQASGELATAEKSAAVYPTNFRDGELLFRTLKEFGVNPVRQGTNIVCTVEQSRLIFRQHAPDGIFDVEIENEPDMRKMFQYLSDVDEDYRRCLQEMVYEKVKERAAARNMTIEREEVLEDRSIVLTLTIQG